MAKIKLGNINPSIKEVTVYKIDDNGNEVKAFSETDKYYQLRVEIDQKDLGEALINATSGKNDEQVKLSDIIKSSIKNTEDEDDVFMIAAIALERSIKMMENGPEKLVLQAAMTYCKQIAKGEF